MKIAIYNQQSEPCLGGVDAEVAALAEAFAPDHDVEIVQHRPWLTVDRLAETFAARLPGVRLRFVDKVGDAFGLGVNPVRRYRQARRRLREATEAADLAVVMATDFPPYCHARRGILRVIFPLRGGFDGWPFTVAGGGILARLKQRLSAGYHRLEWASRMNTYHAYTANSDYTRTWTKTLWGINCDVIYPPVDVRAEPGDKAPVILSAGRFSPEKKYAEMARAFGMLTRHGVPGWEFVCAGIVGDPGYLAELRGVAPDGMTIFTDVPRPRLNQLFCRSSIYWHSNGFGVDERATPGLVEHFGITTVEAMAAGCVPVVVNKAGQRETVRHGVDGFRFDTLEDLVGYTAELIRDEPLRRKLSVSARERAGAFARGVFQGKFRALARRLVGPSIGGGPALSEPPAVSLAPARHVSA